MSSFTAGQFIFLHFSSLTRRKSQDHLMPKIAPGRRKRVEIQGPCAYLGDPARYIDWKPREGCSGNSRRIDVFTCDVFVECVRAGRQLGLPDCLTCEYYEPETDR